VHSRRSLYETHGIHAPSRHRLRPPPIARLAIAQILTVLGRLMSAIEAKLAARHAIAELATRSDTLRRSSSTDSEA